MTQTMTMTMMPVSRLSRPRATQAQWTSLPQVKNNDDQDESHNKNDDDDENDDEIMMTISGTKYEFRVVAENRAGKSQPSETTLPQVVSFIMILIVTIL